MSNPDLVPTAVAARMLGVSPRHVSRLVAQGVITPAISAPGLRGAFLFHRADVDALARRRVAS